MVLLYILVIKEYIDDRGISHFAKWFGKLNAIAAAKVTTYVTRMENNNFSRAKSLGGGVSECKIDFGPGCRVYFGKDGDIASRWYEKKTTGRHKICESFMERIQVTQKNGEIIMALTSEFKETVKKRADTDPEFREALLQEGIQCLLDGDMVTGKCILRNYINATIGFAELGNLTSKPPKSLMRMLSPGGNPRADNLFEIVGHLQQVEGVYCEVLLRH